MRSAERSDVGLGSYVVAVRRRWWMLLVGAVLGGLAVTVFAGGSEPRFSTYAEVVIGSRTADDAAMGSSSAPVRLPTELEFATADRTQEALRAALDDAGLAGVQTEAYLNPRRAALVFAAIASDGETASRAANVFAEVFIAERAKLETETLTRSADELRSYLEQLRLEQAELLEPIRALELERIVTEDRVLREVIDLRIEQLQADVGPELDAISAQQASISASIAELSLDATLATAGRAFQSVVAGVPDAPVAPTLSESVVLGIVVGMLAAAAVVVIWETLDQRVRTVDDLRRLLPGVAVLGSVPVWDVSRLGSAVAADAPRSVPGAALTRAGASTWILLASQGIRRLLVVSLHAGNDERVLGANLAWAVRRQGRVHLVDVDLGRARLATAFGLPEGPGVAEVIEGAATLAPHRMSDGWSAVSGLDVLVAGMPRMEEAELLAGDRFLALVTDLAASGLVVLDGPSPARTSDSVLAARAADGVLLAVTAGKDRVALLRATAARFAEAGCPVVGVVFLQRRWRRSDDAPADLPEPSHVLEVAT
jgi:Mrp family chromosome partitioning ATPase